MGKHTQLRVNDINAHCRLSLAWSGWDLAKQLLCFGHVFCKSFVNSQKMAIFFKSF